MKSVSLMLIAVCTILLLAVVPVAGDLQCKMDITPKYVDHGQTFNVKTQIYNPYPVYVDHSTMDYYFDNRIEVVDNTIWCYYSLGWKDAALYCDDIAVAEPGHTDGPYFTGKIGNNIPYGTSLPIRFEAVNYCYDGMCYDENGDPLPEGCTVTEMVHVWPASKPGPVPEFPTFVLPGAMIVGILGVVLYIRKTREH